jgi:pyruvate formate lyase activating enzyme
MRAAAFYETLADRHVRCQLCPHECDIAPQYHGVCGVRFNSDGKLYTLVYDKVISHNVDPIEKKPLFHFQPGSTSYSIATVGCNMRCLHCQNWEISQWSKEKGHATVPGEPVTPEQIVNAARHSRARSISYTYTEPTIFFELAYDTAVLARQAGLKNVFVTNGYTSPPVLRQLAGVLDAANVDLKFWNEDTHLRITGARLAPVLDSIRLYHELGVWLEVTTLVIPGLNDSDTDLRGIAGFIRSVSPDIPWHLSAFHPTYKMKDRPRTPATVLHRARQIGTAAGLRYVYEGNLLGQGNEATYCHGCRKVLIERYGYTILRNMVRDGCCPDCDTAVAGVDLTPSAR